MSSWEEEEGEVEEEIWQRGAGHCYRRSQWPRRTHQLSAPLPAAATIPFSLLLSQQSGSCSHASMTPLTRRLIAQNDASPSDFFKLKLTRCHFLYIVQQCNPRLRLHVTRLRLAPWQHGASNKRQNESALSSGGDAFISLRGWATVNTLMRVPLIHRKIHFHSQSFAPHLRYPEVVWWHLSSAD